MTIEEFIAARLDDDERIARAATQGNWEWQQHKTDEWCLRAGDTPVIRALSYETPCLEVGDADEDHIARHDPARVLRQCAAMRVALDWYINDDEMVMAATINAIAAIWSDHPDYREDWDA